MEVTTKVTASHDLGDGDGVKIDYTNYRGERRWHHIRPVRVVYGTTFWHPSPQWLLTAFSFDKGEFRDYAMCGIHVWKVA